MKLFIQFLILVFCLAAYIWIGTVYGWKLALAILIINEADSAYHNYVKH